MMATHPHSKYTPNHNQKNNLEKMNDVFGQSILIPVTKKKYDENMTNFSFCPFFLIYTF